MKKFVGFIVNVISLFSVQRAVAISYKFLTSPRKGQIKHDEVFPFLNSATQTQLPYKDSYIQTYQWNAERSDLPIIIFFHGWESNSNRWEAMVTYFGNNYRYIAVDAIGLGLSPGKKITIVGYADMIDFCLKTFQPTYVISHSLGSFSLLNRLAVDQYPSVEKAVLLGCLDEYSSVVKNYVAMMGYRSVIHKRLIQKVEQIIKMPIQAYASYLLVEKCTVPLLLVHDRGDDVIYESDCVKFHQKMVDLNQNIVATEGLGHSLQDKVVYQSILDFIEGN
ncbi:alpha/beta hydrolase [Myroides phaeus]|uniref:alpha/beta hydrolase n=1 Tax=Myroides phaeus TaxID=702745 RepID=UPI002DB7ABA6|nr:alpha/beta hydrolase [Myroides phaeus]MEC4117811.1 alpha/beta hydrolase [Myroides phaeus]